MPMPPKPYRVAFRTYQVSVGATAVRIISDSNYRTAYGIKVPSGASVYISADPAVTTTDGLLMPAGVETRWRFADSEDVRNEVWAIAPADGAVTLYIREDWLEEP